MVWAFGDCKVHSVSKYSAEYRSQADQRYRALSERQSETGLKVYINGDGADVYRDMYRRIAMDENGTFSATLILVGIRLGIDRVTPVYWDSLKATLRLPQSMGIAG